MRLIHTSLATAAVLAVSGTAFAAGTRDEVPARMGGTSHIQSGGQLQLVATRKPKSGHFHVKIHYDVTVKSKTILGFAVYPCKGTKCTGQSTSKITLGGGLRHVTFNGHIPVVKRPSGKACMFAQIRDHGRRHPNSPGRIIRANGHKGVTFCRTVH